MCTRSSSRELDRMGDFVGDIFEDEEIVGHQRGLAIFDER